MMRISRNLVIPALFCCATLVFALQTPDSELGRELEAGRQAAGQNKYADAMTHFQRANELQQGKCSECYVWLARIDIASGILPEALAHAEQGVSSAASNTERARAQLYRGMILGRLGNLAQAEVAFKAASQANPACVECKFNLGFVLLKESKDSEGVTVLKQIAPQFAGTVRGREIQRFIDNPSRIRQNYAPEFSAKSKSGEEVSLDSLKGKVVLLDFWGTWCTPCRVSLPRLKDLAATIDPARVAIVSIDEGDSPAGWEHFIQANGMTWTQIYDGDRSLHDAFHVDGFPRYYVLNKDGIIVDEFKGWSQLGEATISNAIVEALKK